MNTTTFSYVTSQKLQGKLSDRELAALQRLARCVAATLTRLATTLLGTPHRP